MSGAAIILKQNKLMRTFRDAGAVSPDTARSVQELGVRNSWVFRRLVSRGVFILVGTERYYMDEQIAEAFVGQRRTRALVITALVLLAFVIWLLVR